MNHGLRAGRGRGRAVLRGALRDRSGSAARRARDGRRSAAISRRRRARPATRRPSACAAQARAGPDRDRAHRHRPGRDGPLPAGRPRPGRRALLGMAPAPRPDRPPAAGGDARGHARLLRGGRPGLARGRVQPRSRAGPQPAAPRRPAGAAGDPSGRGRRTCWRPPRSCETSRRCSSGRSTRRSGRPARAAPRRPSSRPGSRPSRPRCGGWSCSGSPSTPRARPCRSAPTEIASIERLAAARGQRHRAARRGHRGRLRVRHRPLPARRPRRRSVAAGRAGRARPVPVRRLGGPLHGGAGSCPARPISARSTSRCSTRPCSRRTLTVRAWQDGDRMQPAGPGRHEVAPGPVRATARCRGRCGGLLPVVESAGEIAWVAGVAVSDAFKVSDRTTDHRPSRGARGPVSGCAH